MHCPRCGASVTVPDDLYVETTRCAYCGTVTPLPDELAQARQTERLVREQKAKARAHAEQQSSFTHAAKRATSMVGWIVAMAALGTLVVACITVYFVMRQSEPARASVVQTLSDADRRASLAALEAKLGPLRDGGCKRVVVNPEAQSVAATLSLRMNADGNCAKLVMASSAPGALGVTWTPPAGTAEKKSDASALELEHCPTVSGEHALALTGPTSGYAYSVVDCPPAREKFATDPEKNGSATVSARLKTLTSAGCSRVLLAPEKRSGSSTLTATMRPGPFCAVVVAATGVPGAKLALSAASPIGETLATVPPAPVVESIMCPKTAGPHKIEVTPTTPHYFTIAGVDCPKKVAGRLGR